MAYEYWKDVQEEFTSISKIFKLRSQKPYDENKEIEQEEVHKGYVSLNGAFRLASYL